MVRIHGGLFGGFGILSKLTSRILSSFNSGLGNASPSKKTKKSANYFMQGFGNQISKLMPSSLQQIKDLATNMTEEFDNNLGIAKISDGISINPSDFSIDTNQFIDYGQISGAIATQNNVKIESDLSYQMKQAIIEGMRNIKIPVEIEAKTEEGIIFKKVQKSANEYLLQTGENPFPVLA